MAHAALGDAYLAQYRIAPNEVLPGKALNAASEALRLAPRAPRVRLLYARAKRLMGSSASAAAELHALVEERPKDPEVHAALGALYVDLADWPNAVDHYQKALALRPDYWGSHARLGFAYLKMGRVDDAVAAYMHATVLQPDNAQALQMLGTAYVAQGDLPRARDSYSKAIALRPDSMSFLNLGTIEFDSGDFAAAKRSYARAVDLDEGRAALWRGLGDANAALGMRDDARRSFEECARLSRLAASLDGADAEALAERAVRAQKLGDSALQSTTSRGRWRSRRRMAKYSTCRRWCGCCRDATRTRSRRYATRSQRLFGAAAENRTSVPQVARQCGVRQRARGWTGREALRCDDRGWFETCWRRRSRSLPWPRPPRRQRQLP